MSSRCRITVRAGGALCVEGEVELVDAAGNRIDTSGRTRLLLCRCGASKVRPFCDSSHYRVDFDEPEADAAQSASNSSR